MASSAPRNSISGLDNAIPAFVIGAPRSGTTMLGSMLGSHSQGLAIPESEFFSTAAPTSPDEIVSLPATIDRFVAERKFELWGLDLAGRRPEGRGRYADAVLWMVERFAESRGKTGVRFWVDHDPSHTPATATLAAHFPTARFIHLLRDGRAVAASVMAASFGPSQIFNAARFWAYYVAVGMAAQRFLAADRFVELRYEAIVRDPETALAPALARLGCAFEPGMISGGDYDLPTRLRTLHPFVGKPPIPERIDAWRGKLSDRDLEIFEAYAEDLLTLLGYERAHRRPRQITTAELRALNLKRRLRRLGVLLGAPEAPRTPGSPIGEGKRV
jgi:hypothetical protein